MDHDSHDDAPPTELDEVFANPYDDLAFDRWHEWPLSELPDPASATTCGACGCGPMRAVGPARVQLACANPDCRDYGVPRAA